MSAAQLSEAGAGCYRLDGEIGFASVATLLEQGQRAFGQVGSAIELDLAGVSRIDSAGLALLLEWMRLVRSGGGTIQFRNIPEQLRAIAQASNLDSHLPVLD